MRIILICLLIAACSSDSEDLEEGATQAKGKKNKRQNQGQSEAEDTGWTGNGPRVVELRVEPEKPSSTDILRVRKQIEQAAGTRVKPRLQWVKNGAPIKGQVSQNLMSEHFKKGDKLWVILSFPDTGGQKFKEHKSNEITIGDTRPEINVPRNKDIFNARLSGLIAEEKPFPIEASDIDDDDLIFRLEGAPNGMSIRKTGKHSAQLEYNRSADFEPKEYRIKVIADDKELTAEWEFGATLWDNGVVETDDEGFEGEDSEDAEERTRDNDAPIEGWKEEDIEGWKAEPENEVDEAIEGWSDEPIEGLEEE